MVGRRLHSPPANNLLATIGFVNSIAAHNNGNYKNLLMKKRSAPKTSRPEQEKAKSDSRLMDQRNRALGDWREDTLARMRALIFAADPEMIEERKWKKPSNAMAGIPVWSHNGIVCTGETYTKVVKLTFARGATLPDPSRLFNSSLEGNTRRAIDIHEGEKVDARAFKALVKAAVAQNAPTPKKAKQPRISSLLGRPSR